MDELQHEQQHRGQSIGAVNKGDRRDQNGKCETAIKAALLMIVGTHVHAEQQIPKK